MTDRAVDRATELSVVMVGHNDEKTVKSAMESVASQLNDRSELLFVDDGSSDHTVSIAKDQASLDGRIVVIERRHGGLTSALVQACDLAKGRYIARQDADDISLPGRFAAQLACLQQGPDLALVGCGTRFVSDEGDFLYEVLPDADQIRAAVNGLQADIGVAILAGHGSAMFPADAYRKAGGYRPQFYYAQDKDLFLRLMEAGELEIVPETLYQAVFDGSGISGTKRWAQVELENLCIACARARRSGASEESFLEAAKSIRPPWRKQRGRREQANGEYFVAACLRRNRNSRARHYYARALSCWPFHWRALYGLEYHDPEQIGLGSCSITVHFGGAVCSRQAGLLERGRHR